MGTVAFVTLSGGPQRGRTRRVRRGKNCGALAVMPRLTCELPRLRDPPGSTVTVPATRALVITTLSPAPTMIGPRRRPSGWGGRRSLEGSDGHRFVGGAEAELAELLLSSPLYRAVQQ